MPLYEYRCDKCDKVFEVIQKFSDAPLKECPDCGASVDKLMSRTSFQLKGGGWYATDYKKSAAPGSASMPTTPSPKVDTTAAPAATSKKTET